MNPLQCFSLTLASLGLAASLNCQTLFVSGDNSYGQLGSGDSSYYSEFVTVAESVVSVSAGRGQALFEDTSGAIWLVGQNLVGSTDDAPSLVFGAEYADPVRILDEVDYYEVWDLSCFFRFSNDNRLYSTGFPLRGVSGLFSFQIRETPTLVENVSDIVDVSSSQDATLYLDSGGKLYGFGGAFNLGLGLGGADPSEPVLLEEDVVSMEQGLNYPIFLQANGDLKSYEFSGGTVVLGTDVVDFSIGFVGSEYSLFYIDGAGDLFGYSNTKKTAVLLASAMRSVESSGPNVFFISEEDQLWAMGSNATGLMGKGDFEAADTPVMVRNGVKAVALNDETLYVVTTDNVLLAAGYNGSSRMGQPETEFSRSPLTLGLGNAATIEPGSQSLYYIESGGDLFGVGRNESGQLGLGDTNHRIVPELIAANVAQVSTMDLSIEGLKPCTVFTTMNGDLWGMGSNAFNQLDDSDETYFESPILIAQDVLFARASYDRVVFLKSDNSLWQQGWGDGYESGRKHIADNVADFDVDSILWYIDTEGALKTKSSGIIDNYTWENDVPSDQMPDELTIDTDVLELNVMYPSVVYRKEGNGLFVSGSNAIVGGAGTVAPSLIDTDVVSIDASRNYLMYQKVDTSLWLQGRELDLYPPEFDEVPEGPANVFSDLRVMDFAVGSYNAMFIVESTEPPEVIRLYASGDSPFAVGQPVQLNAQINGGYTDFTWYEGVVGDRSHPLGGQANLKAVVYPYLTTRYWLELSNEFGDDQSAEALQVEVELPAYGEWALSKGLSGADGAYFMDPENDGNANLLEFAYNGDPFKAEALGLWLGYSANESYVEFEFVKPLVEGLQVVPLIRDGAGDAQWVELLTPGSEVIEQAQSILIRRPVESIDSLLLRFRMSVE